MIDIVAGPLVVNANNADNAINYSGVGGRVSNGLVSVDIHETIEFSNKTTLTINALAGSDTINLNNPNTPTGLTEHHRQWRRSDGQRHGHRHGHVGH